MKRTAKDKITWKQALNIPVVVRRLLYKYVSWESLWYTPKCNLKRGDRIKLNWKYKVYFCDEKFITDIWTFDEIDNDGVVDTIEGKTYNYYWLRPV